MSDKINYILDSLSLQQQEIVKSSANLLVTACPGSGKTRVLTRKLAFTVANNTTSRKKIIAITYTNRAAEEIKDRLGFLDIEHPAIWAGTIHQFCLEYIIRPNAMFVPELSKGYKIIDEYVSEKYVQQIVKEMSLNIDFFDILKINKALDDKMQPLETRYRAVSEKYHDILSANKEIDFDLILSYSIHILRTNTLPAESLARTIGSIYVDEYQDTNELQYEIIGCLTKKNTKINMMFVGDVDQAIYESLGGVPKTREEIECITGLRFELATLSGCYRSTQRIVDYYSYYKEADYKIQSLSHDKMVTGNIQLNCTINKENVYNAIAQIISDKLSKGIPQNEICVIAPRWEILFPLSKALRQLLPEVTFDAPGISPIRSDDMNVFYKFSKIIFTEPGKKVSRRKRIASEVIQMLFNDFDISLPMHIDSFWVLDKINSINPSTENGIEYFEIIMKKFLDDCGIKEESYPLLFEQFADFIDKINYRLERYSELSNELDSFKKMFEERYGVVVTSCHSIKGEEYDTVIAFGILKGFIPHWDAVFNSSDFGENEARKMLYVIASRAKKSLYLFSERGRFTQSKSEYRITDILGNYNYAYDIY